MVYVTAPVTHGSWVTWVMGNSEWPCSACVCVFVCVLVYKCLCYLDVMCTSVSTSVSGSHIRSAAHGDLVAPTPERWCEIRFRNLRVRKYKRLTNTSYRRVSWKIFQGFDKKIADYTQWKMYADLTIAWNCSAVARRSIFNSANNDHWVNMETSIS